MRLSEFDYHLPPELIAQYPLKNRSDSRLMVVDHAKSGVAHHQFKDIVQFLQSGDVLVLNNTRVLKARLQAQKETGGKVEILFERPLSETHFLGHAKSSKGLKPGQTLRLINGDVVFRVIESKAGLVQFEIHSSLPLLDMLDTFGEIPLPPYMHRLAEEEDLERYQTVFSLHGGSVAAPTAGLHFDTALLQRCKQMGVEIAYVTLHVGAGTFAPVRVDTITDHQMHSEYYEIDEVACAILAKARAENRRIIAVGTTSLRTLETIAINGSFTPTKAWTNIFIYPGYDFKCVNALITNFHVPQSTLLMLVCAFIGQEKLFAAYQEAIQQQYRFYSYGDAMFLIRP